MRIDASSFYDPRTLRRTMFADRFWLGVSICSVKSAVRIAVPVDETDRDRRRRFLRHLQHDRSYQNASLREKVLLRRTLLRSLVSPA